ncbi:MULTISPECIES: EAL domain-containing protein [unclassified Acidocella]|uniref:bifunctional diguanylate cyclase/phosphodiesterase n=1 Tax=unclassified Acidocella TaxID=2648610 RepID=UPI000686B5B9|nr:MULTISPECIES: EAL domain-containing protein [unclassified Acidocella]WBO61054.1 EAL domain-containing protein [Acidocella sp. MX-AZ03]
MARRNTYQANVAFTLTRAFPALLLTGAVGALAILLLTWSAKQTDQISVLRQEEVVVHIVSQMRAQIAHDQESSTVWDTAIQKTRADDTEWMDNNLGTWMHSYFGFDGAYVLNSQNIPIYAFANGTITAPLAYDAIGAQVAPLVRILRHNMRDGVGTMMSGDTLSPGVADIMVICGHPAIVSVKPIVSDSGSIKQVAGTEYLHVAVRFLDGSFVQQLTSEYLFDGLHFAWLPMHSPTEAAYPIDNNAGRLVGYFIWRPERPGTTMLAKAMPILEALLFLALITVMGFVAAVRSRSLMLRASEVRMRHLAFHDPLTSLPNRMFFNECVDEALDERGGASIALLYLDLDRFKEVNDSLGHPAGDALIKEFATRLRALVRDGDVVARIGGDEFTIMLVNVCSREEVEPLCTRIVESVRRPFDLDGNRMFVGLSIGVAIAPQDGNSRIELLRKADIALYSAKSAGRGRYTFFDASMDDAITFRQEIEMDLRAALQVEGEIVLHYQPIYSANGYAITGFEALLRWRHAKHGWISPEVFIPIAEASGLIETLGEWVLREACQAALNWPHRTVAVNASGVELSNPLYATKVATILRMTGLPASRLEIELTETAADSHVGAAADNLLSLRALGVRIAIDDFGVGFSSLARLNHITVDRVKIDRSFISGFGDQHGDEAIVRAIVDLAHTKGLRVTAEGVETQQQRDGLTRIGCDNLQGFMFSKARPAVEIPRILESFSEVANDKVLPDNPVFQWL